MRASHTRFPSHSPCLSRSTMREASFMMPSCRRTWKSVQSMYSVFSSTSRQHEMQTIVRAKLSFLQWPQCQSRFPLISRALIGLLPSSTEEPKSFLRSSALSRYCALEEKAVSTALAAASDERDARFAAGAAGGGRRAAASERRPALRAAARFSACSALFAMCLSNLSEEANCRLHKRQHHTPPRCTASGAPSRCVASMRGADRREGRARGRAAAMDERRR
mmetsp:Transcript_21665/g.52047  ORF Transcript_21665/g.52047 Transcript_21665/m.52047 type:complete len:221 (+) Transcript_21665:425-1087(+)